MKATNFCWRKNLVFFQLFGIHCLSMATTTHPPTFPLPPVGPSSLLHVRPDPLPFWSHRVRLENRGRIQQNTVFFPCAEKTPGHQNRPYLSTGILMITASPVLSSHLIYWLEAPMELKSTFPRIFEEMDGGELYEFTERYSVLPVNSSFLHLTLKSSWGGYSGNCKNISPDTKK